MYQTLKTLIFSIFEEIKLKFPLKNWKTHLQPVNSFGDAFSMCLDE